MYCHVYCIPVNDWNLIATDLSSPRDADLSSTEMRHRLDSLNLNARDVSQWSYVYREITLARRQLQYVRYRVHALEFSAADGLAARCTPFS